MAAATSGRSLEQTPTWAVAVVCFVLVLISIIIEHIIELIAKWLKKKHKSALYEALEKIKSELMLLGFISLLLTVGQGPISNICISQKIGNTWHPCGKNKDYKSNKEEDSEDVDETHSRRLLSLFNETGGGSRRVLAAAGTDKCSARVASHPYLIFVFTVYDTRNKPGLLVACPKCKQHFCLECDMYIHESLHNCPGCESTRHSKIPNINEG